MYRRQMCPYLRTHLIIALCCFPLFLQAQKVIRVDFSEYFVPYQVEGCFTLLDAAQDRLLIHNDSLCNIAYLPASTFKIPNALIALNEGIVRDTLQLFTWNGYKWPHEAWNKDQTLVTALENSCIWVFFEIADQVGVEKYQQYLDTLNYGNKVLTGPPDRFWLAGDFGISARQQIEFLEKFYFYQLPFSREHIDLVKHILTVERTNDYTLFAKTGAGRVGETQYIRWYVGYLVSDNHPYLFAMNYLTDDYSLGVARREITKNILQGLGLMEEEE